MPRTFTTIYITRLCRRREDTIHNNENENICDIGQDEPPYRKYKLLELGGGHLYDFSSV
jgi:hypothetical protein